VNEKMRRAVMSVARTWGGRSLTAAPVLLTRVLQGPSEMASQGSCPPPRAGNTVRKTHTVREVRRTGIYVAGHAKWPGRCRAADRGGI